jgi:hypothetical protein
MLGPEDGGTAVRRNIGNYLSDGTAQHTKILESSVLSVRKFKLRSCFLGTFAKLRKATISFVASVRPPVYLYVCLFLCLSLRTEQLSSSWKAFHEKLIFQDFLKIRRENSSLIKIDKNNGCFT